MTADLRGITRFIELLKNSRLSSTTNDMLEYLLYQLNLAMLRDVRLSLESCEFPCDTGEIEEINGLIIAAGNGEADWQAADDELRDKLLQIVDRIHYVGEYLESEKLTRTA